MKNNTLKQGLLFISSKSILFCLIIVYIIVQLVYINYYSLAFRSDSFNYYKYALTAINESTYYPSPGSIYFTWIVAPVYINYLVGILHIEPTPIIIGYSNIILNLVQLGFVYLITKRLFDSRTAIVAAILYIFYLNNLGLVLLNYTELMFGVFILCSIYLYLKNNHLIIYIICGFTAGLALGVRPTAYALILVYFLVYFYKIYHRQFEHKKIIFISLGLLLYILPMGLLSKNNIGYFIFSSTTGAENLALSANEQARGVYDNYTLKNDSILLSKSTFKERDEYLMQRSIRYIKEYPVQFISLIPRKIYSTFISDGWALGEVIHSQKWNLNNFMKASKANSLDSFYETPLGFKVAFYVVNIFHQLLYFFILLMYLYQLFLCFKNYKINQELIFINIFIVIGIGMTIAGSVGNPRYKYNFLIVALILIAPLVNNLLNRKQRNNI